MDEFSENKQEAMNKYGAILQYDLPDREDFTIIWAKPPGRTAYQDQPFGLDVELSLPTDDELNGTDSDERYLWIGS